MSLLKNWNVGGGRILSPPLVFGIINLTPDSFYDGGSFVCQKAALARAKEFAKAGVQVLDIGAESTRPGARELDPKEEWQRLEGALTDIVPICSEHQTLLSVDTYRAETAERALLVGAQIINDVSAFEFDPRLKEVLFEHRPGYVLMHSQGRPSTMQDAPLYKNVVQEVTDFLSRKMDELLKGGLPEDRIMLDPGIGFGKTLQHNLDLLRGLDKLKSLGRPLLVGISNKSFLGELLGLAVNERQCATQALTALLAKEGVEAHRVHEAVATLQTLYLTYSLFFDGVSAPAV